MRFRLFLLLLAALLPFALSAAAAEQALELGTGFNFVSPAVAPASPPSSAALLAAHAQVAAVFKFDAASQSFVYQLRISGDNLFGVPFDLLPGAGYAIRCDAPVTLSLSGEDVPVDSLSSLSAGFHLAGLKVPAGSTARALLEARGDLSSVFRWRRDAAAFGFVLRLPDGSLFGDDFPLERGAGYFLRASGEGGPAPRVATPTIAPEAGIYNAARTVTLACATAGATIRYTTDGSVPTHANGTTYAEPFQLAATSTVKAFAGKLGMADSEAASAAFTIDLVSPDPPSAVTLSPSGGTVVANALNGTNTNLTVSAAITPGQATGGFAELLIGGASFGTPVKDLSIASEDAAVTFDLGAANPAALQTLVPSGGELSVRIADAAGNSATSSALNPTLLVDYVRPTVSAPVNAAQTLVSGAVSTSTVAMSEAGTIHLVKTNEPSATIAQVAAAEAAKRGFVARADAEAQVAYAVTVPARGEVEDGVYDIVAVDRAGNVSDPLSGWLTVDNTTPRVAGVSPSAGWAGTAVTVSGVNFGDTQGDGSVAFNGLPAGVASSWSATSIVVAVPQGATAGPVVVTAGGRASNADFLFFPSSAPMGQADLTTNDPTGRGDATLARYLVNLAWNEGQSVYDRVGTSGLYDYASYRGNQQPWCYLNDGRTDRVMVTYGDVGGRGSNTPPPDFFGYLFKHPVTVYSLVYKDYCFRDGGTFSSAPTLQWMDASGTWSDAEATWSSPYVSSIQDGRINTYTITPAQPIAGARGVRLRGDTTPSGAWDENGWASATELAVYGTPELARQIDFLANLALEGTPVCSENAWNSGDGAPIRDGDFNSVVNVWSALPGEKYVGIVWGEAKSDVSAVGIALSFYGNGGWFLDTQDHPLKVQYTVDGVEWLDATGLEKGTYAANYPGAVLLTSWLAHAGAWLFTFDAIPSARGVRVIGSPGGSEPELGGNGFLQVRELEVFRAR